MAIRIFGEHIEDVAAGYPGSRSSMFWGAFIAPSRREELSRAAFEAVSAAQCRLFPEASCRPPATVAEVRFWSAQLRAEASIAGTTPAELERQGLPLMVWLP